MPVAAEPAPLTEQSVPIDWDDLYFDLKNESAVLILGPEFHSREGISAKELLYRELVRRDDHGIVHFYPGNGIFLFKSEMYKTKSQKIASQFFKQLETDNSILEKVIELPFKMIINTNPDKLLVDKYHEKDLECQFDYFTWRPNKKKKEISNPDSYNPLIFNLFGSVDSHESIVLDFEDLFDHLRTLLNNVNVPEEIRSILNETDSFIFIGFHLEKWDTQLLFRYLNMKEHGFDDSKKNYTTRALNLDMDSESFFRQQFNLKYYGVPIEFLEQMHEKYFEMAVDEDRKIVNEWPPRKLVEHYIANDDLQKALNFLTMYEAKNGLANGQDLVLLKSNFFRYMYLKNKRLESTEFLEIQRNKLKQAILTITDTL